VTRVHFVGVPAVAGQRHTVGSAVSVWCEPTTYAEPSPIGSEPWMTVAQPPSPVPRSKSPHLSKPVLIETSRWSFLVEPARLERPDHGRPSSRRNASHVAGRLTHVNETCWSAAASTPKF
jgi:hypothetical protein